MEIMEACGFKSVGSVKPAKFFWRVNEHQVKSFEEIYFQKGSTSSRNKIYSLLN
jgi:hypothetical protein